MSDREQAGLRGPVKTCVEEVIYPPTTSPGGSEIPERRQTTTQEFDRSGRVAAYRGSNNGSEWVSENAYDDQGRFLRSTSSSAGKVYHEVEYLYDSDGKLTSYTSKGAQGAIRALCSHDEHGQKSVTFSFDPKILEAGRQRASGGSPLRAAEAGHGVPDGGSVRTLYDVHDRPVEAHILGVDGQLISRVICTYNEAGKLLEEKRIVESPEFLVPPSLRAQMLLGGGTLDQLKAQLSKFTGGESGQHVLSYDYDSNGRQTERRTRVAPFMEQVVSTSYNEHGDVAEEHWVTRGEHGATTDESGNIVPSSPPSEPSTSTILYTYIYDDHGNWTEQKTTYPNRPDGQFQSSTTKRRQLTYY